MGTTLRPCLRAALAALLVFTVLAAPAVPAGAEPAGAHSPPVDGPVVDLWRPPPTPYGAGNRGIDYRTEPGEGVRASAAGEVTFAGSVGGSLHVTVLHEDGLRTSYSFLASVSVRRGDAVGRGQVVGTASERLHFGARAGERYVDPGLLLGGGEVAVHLVPVALRSPQPEATERHWLAGIAATGLARVASAVAWAADSAVVPHYVAQWVGLAGHLGDLRDRARLFSDGQDGCTPSSSPLPPRPPGRRIAVLVAGFGSRGGDASILGLDTEALGYAAADVAQLSYRGGRVPGVGNLLGVPVTGYEPADSTVDIRTSAQHLRELLASIRAAHPGVPVDVFAHSQGGVVARVALGRDGDGLDPRLPEVGHLVTLGTPHHGTDLATAGALLLTTRAGELAAAVASRATGGELALDSDAARQLAETSGLVRGLAERRLPPGTAVTSIAARGDLVVPALHSALEGATNVVVALDGVRAHGALPSSPEAHREVALALAGAGPTCRRVGPDLTIAAGISLAQDAVGTIAGVAGLVLDGHRVRPSSRIGMLPPGDDDLDPPCPAAGCGGGG
ncbi:MAG TPA: peptidoglycan DD-metalloendopeptidase family protein [Acidimicrobiales bacterium]|nr:peptidoglycan DD-metalloendopeptidase family protein [Acidimicrobiales bacterium]